MQKCKINSSKGCSKYCFKTNICKVADYLVSFWLWNWIYKKRFKLSSWFSLMWVFTGKMSSQMYKSSKTSKASYVFCLWSKIWANGKKNSILKAKTNSKLLEICLQINPNKPLLKKLFQTVKANRMWTRPILWRYRFLNPFKFQTLKPNLSKIFSKGKFFIQNNLNNKIEKKNMIKILDRQA